MQDGGCSLFTSLRTTKSRDATILARLLTMACRINRSETEVRSA
jgi:hypothetical protein